MDSDVQPPDAPPHPSGAAAAAANGSAVSHRRQGDGGQPLATRATGAVKDFPDKLSPMLVKELRQGTRTKMFAGAFIVLQAVLALSLLASTGSQQGRASGVIFWMVLSVALLVVMPLRGFGALYNEHRLMTMDLILLTRLSAWRITFGKWAALVSQSALIVVAALPYAVLRYFLGGVNVLAELFWVATLFFVSAVSTAIMVGFSAHRFFLIRALVALAVLGFGLSMSGGMFGDLVLSDSFARVFRDPDFLLSVLGVVLIGTFVIYYVLDMGATFIAPAAENHATRKRLAALGILSLIFTAPVFGADERAIFAVAAVIMAVVCFDALTENPNLLPSIFTPFVQRGAPGRLLGRVFYPGWHTAVFYFLVVVALFTAYAVYHGFFTGLLPERTDSFNLSFACLVALVIFPLAAVQLFLPNSPQVFALYILVQCISALFSLLIVLVAISTNLEEIYWIGCFLPLTLLIGGAQEEELLQRPFYYCAIGVLTVSVIILMIRGFPIFRRTRQIERQILERLRSAQTVAAPDRTAAGAARPQP